MELLFWPFFGIGIVTIAAIVLWIWALVDCVQVPDDSMYQSGNKLVWVLIIVLTNWIGAIVYLAIGRPRGGTKAPEGPSDGARPDPPPPAGALPPPPGGSP